MGVVISNLLLTWGNTFLPVVTIKIACKLREYFSLFAKRLLCNVVAFNIQEDHVVQNDNKLLTPLLRALLTFSAE